MAGRRGRPRKIALDTVIQQLTKRNTVRKCWEFDLYKTADKKKLIAAFLDYLNENASLVREKLTRSPDYDEDHGRGEARRPSYQSLPPDLIITWAQHNPRWREEPVIMYYIEKWQQELVALRGEPTGADRRKWLRRIHRNLIPAEAKGAGHYGADELIAGAFEETYGYNKELTEMYRSLPGPRDKELRLGKLFDHILSKAAEYDQFLLSRAAWIDRLQEEEPHFDPRMSQADKWRWDLWNHLKPDDLEDEGLDESLLRTWRGWAIALLDQWIPGKRQQVKGLAYTNLAQALAPTKKVTIDAWLVAEGHQVEKDEPLLRVVTEKGTMDIVRAQVSGGLCRILVPPGEKVVVPVSICIITTRAGDISLRLLSEGSVQTVKNAVKRAKARRREEVEGK